MDDEMRHALTDAGALGYDDNQIKQALGLDDDQFKDAMRDGGRELLEQGAARFRFAVGRKLMELAANGDMKAMHKIEQMSRARKR
jgi:hypothetical protein